MQIYPCSAPLPPGSMDGILRYIHRVADIDTRRRLERALGLTPSRYPLYRVDFPGIIKPIPCVPGLETKVVLPITDAKSIVHIGQTDLFGIRWTRRDHMRYTWNDYGVGHILMPVFTTFLELHCLESGQKTNIRYYCNELLLYRHDTSHKLMQLNITPDEPRRKVEYVHPSPCFKSPVTRWEGNT